jgi:hypothetical protein
LTAERGVRAAREDTERINRVIGNTSGQVGMQHGSRAFWFIDTAIRHHRSRRSRCSTARWGWPLVRPQEAHQYLVVAEVLSTSAGRVGLPSVQQARQPSCRPRWKQRHQGVTLRWDPHKRMGELFEQVRPFGTHRSTRTPKLEVGRDRGKATPLRALPRDVQPGRAARTAPEVREGALNMPCSLGYLFFA